MNVHALTRGILCDEGHIHHIFYCSNLANRLLDVLLALLCSWWIAIY